MSYFIGVDLGHSNSYFVIKQEGHVVMQQRVVNSAVAIQRAIRPYTPGRAVMEATTNYYWMYKQLRELGLDVILAHPLKTRAIADAKVKNDRLDANILADLLRGDLIPQSYVPSEKIRSLREITRQHVRLTRIRTRIKNQGHSLLVKLNARPTERMSDLFGKKGREWLRQLDMPEVFDCQKQQILEQIEMYNRLIAQVDEKIEAMLLKFPEASVLRQIPGIGVVSAGLLLGEIGGVHRFPSAKHLVGYAGIAPGLYASGHTFHQRGITHQGSKFLRWILCEIVSHHIQKPGPLRDFYLRLKPSKGHGKAVVATARKLLIQIYYKLKEASIPVSAG